ncbi:MAG: FeoA family protein [Eubacterium sp.]|nr:FeoA family protein [Eubacterium sp.]
MIPLIMVNAGEVVTVGRVSGSPDIKKHLEDLGFTPETQVTVVQTSGGNMILKIRDSKLALTKEMASKIMVNP